MKFKKLSDNRGMVYVPEFPDSRRKYRCPDCFACQWCANERCRTCRGKREPGGEEEGSGSAESQDLTAGTS